MRMNKRTHHNTEDWFIQIERRMKTMSIKPEFYKPIVTANLDGEAADAWIDSDRPTRTYYQVRNTFRMLFPDSLQADELRDQLKNESAVDADLPTTPTDR
eukprot:GHVO01004619.1.p1 GENE.GHVO01004619.1~~GHVO01004619.1.p1  ORF type:complete len:100 (+),score=2.69 GHVO01004619.1:199-498(+)